MNWMMKLSVRLNAPMLNYGIYESDIKYLGGEVTYLGNIMTESQRSKVEEAIITLDDVRSQVFMERFKDGSAVILLFIKEGAVHEDDIYPETLKFMEKMDELTMADERFKNHVRKRKLKQKLTLAAQILCVLMAVGLAMVSGNMIFAWKTVTVYVVMFALVLVWGSFYKCWRWQEIRALENREEGL